MPVKLSKLLDNKEGLISGLTELTQLRTMVGVPAEKAGREAVESGEPINNAAIAYIQDNGAPEVNIPARPFMRPGLESIKSDIAPMLKRAGKFALEGERESMLKQFHALGLKAQNAVRKKITDGPFTPLAPSTLAARRAAGRSGTKPLIDTGQLRRAITYVIRRKGKDVNKPD